MKKKILLGLLGLLLAIQLIRPDRSNPPVDPAQDIQQVFQPPAAVLTILKDACYDCHSYETRYPWYSQVAPVSWWLANHIREGREHLNFSAIGALSADKQAKALEEAAEEVQKGEMPLNSYTWTHPEARLSDAQRNTLVSWFEANGGEGTEGAGGEAGGEEHGDDD